MTSDDINQIAIRVSEIMQSNVTSNPLTDEERGWVRLAIKKEAQSIEFRTAVIQKTLGGLVWAALLFIGYLGLEFLKAKGYKP